MPHKPLVFAVAALFLLAGAPARPSDASPPPNLVFILIDNCGKEWFGCYGSEENCTPHIDRLAREGVRIENCYTPPVCGPSRITALTGRYLLRSGLVLHHDAALYSGGGLDPAREITFARILHDAGYRTAVVGKWQINNLYDEPGVLKRHGFDEALVWPGSIDRAKATPAEMARFQQAILADDHEFLTQFNRRIESRYWHPVLIGNGERRVHEGKFGPDLIHEFALHFIRANRARPFLLYYPMMLTHGQSFIDPVVPTPANRDPNRPAKTMYGDMLKYADRLVDEVVKELEKQGLRERTIVFVATDNGTEHTLSARFKGRKVTGGLYQLTEAGSNVPLLVNSPALVPGGRTIKLADFSDLLPTFCELAGASLPNDLTLDGRSFAGNLKNPAAPAHRDWIFNQYGDKRTVRDERFKLYSDGRLFDAAADPDEQRELTGDASAEATTARRKLQQALDAMPPNSPPPFVLRSLSAFKLRQEKRAEGGK